MDALTGVAAYPLFRETALSLALGLHMPNYLDNTEWATKIRKANPGMYLVLRPDHGDDEKQVDESKPPADEAQRFAAECIVPRLVAVPSGTYSATLGICENWHQSNLAWRAAFESALCRIVQDNLKLDYIALSCPTGNLEPSELHLFFDVFRQAAWVSYHAYLGPGRNKLEQETDPWWLWRPTRLWLPVLRQAGITLRLLYTECGTGPRPTDVGLSKEGLARLDVEIAMALRDGCRAPGAQFGGCLPFGFGLEGAMGRDWNLDGYEAHFVQATPAPQTGGKTVDEATQQALIEMEARQNALLTQALKAFRQGKFEGADGIDGLIVALQGGKPLDFTPVWPPGT